MIRPVGFVAVLGFATAAVCLPMAAAILEHVDGHDFMHNDFNCDLRGRHWHSGLVCDWDDRGSHGRSEVDSSVVTRDFVWGSGDTLRLEVAANVHFKRAPQWHVSVRGPTDALDRLRIDDGRIHSEGWLWDSNDDLDIEIQGPALREVSLDGSGDIDLDEVDQPSLHVSIAGSGNVQGKGHVKDLDISIAGSGDAALAELLSDSATVRIAGSGNADIAPKLSADVSVTGSGDVTLHTSPEKLKTRIAGSGGVTTAPEVPKVHIRTDDSST